jgi:dihydropyrimidinase
MVAPPVRKAQDGAELLELLVAGSVDVVATDHCAFLRSQKDLPGAPFHEIPKGLPGVETRLVLLHTLAAVPGLISLDHLARLTSTTPARIFGLYPRKGTIRFGADADLVLFDPEAEWTVEASSLHMNTDFSPYAGKKVIGRVRAVLLRGEIVLENGRIIRKGRGRYLRREPAIGDEI